MKSATLIEIDDRDGIYSFLQKIKNKNMLEIFLNNIIKTNLFGEKIYISATGTIINKLHPIIEKYKNNVELIKINETVCKSYNTYMEKVFIHSKESLKEVIKQCDEVSHLIYFWPASVIFDYKLTKYLINKAEENNYDLTTYNFNTADLNIAPFIISIKSLKELLNNDILKKMKYFFPVYYMINELQNKYKVNCDLKYPQTFLSIPYDISKRTYLTNMGHILKTKHIDNNIDYKNADPYKISRKEIEEWSSYPDRFAIEIGMEKSGNNKFYPKIISERPDWISITKIKLLVNSLKDFPGTIHFDLVGSKDPLVHPEIKSILKILCDFKKMRKTSEVFSNCDTEITVYTDGTGLTDEVINTILINSVDNLLFNTYTGSSENYIEHTGSGSFETVKSNFINYLNKKYEYMKKMNIFIGPKPETGIYMILNKDTENNVNAFMEEWNKTKNIFIRNKKYCAAERVELWKKFYTDYKYPIEHTVIYPYNSFCGKLPDKSVADFTPLKRFVCRKLVNGCYVLTNGKITVCEQDIEGEYVFTDVDFDLIKDFVFNSKYQKCIEDQKNNIFDNPVICSQCDQYYIPVY